MIELAKERLIADYVTRSLADLTTEWRRRATARTGTDPGSWAAHLVGGAGQVLSVDDVPLPAIGAIGADVVAAVSVTRSVWSRWNLLTVAAKQTVGLRFATTTDRGAGVGMVVDAAGLHSDEAEHLALVDRREHHAVAEPVDGSAGAGLHNDAGGERLGAADPAAAQVVDQAGPPCRGTDEHDPSSGPVWGCA